MPSRISHAASGETSAFTADGALVMNYGTPIVSWTLPIKELSEWIVTLEETISSVEPCHRHALSALKCSLQAAYNWHQKEHASVVTEAPSHDDLISYLTSYAAAVAWESIEGRK